MLSMSRASVGRRLQVIASRINRAWASTEAASRPRPRLDRRGNLDQRLYKLDAEVRRTGRVSRRDVNDIFKEMQGLGSSATSSQSLLLIRCCGSLLSEEPAAKRNEIIDQIWTTLIGNKVVLDISHYNALLKVFLENEQPFKPEAILTELEGKGIEPNRVTYQRLIHSYCQSGDIEGATKILGVMKSKEMPVNETVFNSLILGYGKSGDLKAAHETLDLMKSSGIESSNDTYRTLLSAYALKAADANVAKRMIELIDEAQRNDVLLTDRDKLDIIKSVALIDETSPLIETLIQSLHKRMGYNQDCYNMVVDLVNLGKISAAQKLFDTMVPSSQDSSIRVGGMFFINQLVKSGVNTEKVFEICNRLQEKGINDYSFSKAAESALEFCDRDTARTYLKKFLSMSPDKELRVHYFWPLITKCKTQEEVFEILAEDMLSLCYSPFGSLYETFETYVWPKINLDPELFLDKCKSVGYSYSLLVTSLVDHLLRNNALNEATKLIGGEKYAHTRISPRDTIPLLSHVYCVSGDVPKTITILNHVLNNASSQEVQDWAGKFLLNALNVREKFEREGTTCASMSDILTAMKKAKINISQTIADAIKEKNLLKGPEFALLAPITSELAEAGRGAFYEDDDITRPLADMTVDELEAHLIELKAKGMNTRGVVRKLLLAYCKLRPASDPVAAAVEEEDAEEDEVQEDTTRKSQVINRVNELVKEINLEGHEMTNAVRAVLMDFYATQVEDLEAALAMKSQIQKGFNVDDFKVLHLATLFIRKNLLQEAIELLRTEMQNREADENSKPSWKGQSQPDRRVQRDIFKLLNEAAETTKDIKVVKELFELAVGLTGSAVTNVMLGPFMKVHLLNNNTQGMIDEFTNCVETYKQCPWKTQLMKGLIEKEDSSNLQTVTDMSIRCHGEPNTLVDLAVAFIYVKRLKQAKKAMSTPGLRVPTRKLNIVTDRFIKDGDVENLENFVSVSKDLFDVDRDELYYQLIRGYAKVNDPKKALDVWTTMQEEGITATNRTLIYLASLLKEHNMDVPYLVPSKSEAMSPSSTSSKTKMSPRIRSFLDKMELKDATSAYKLYKEVKASGEQIGLSQECNLIEHLMKEDRLQEAFDLSRDLMTEGRFPLPRVLRHLITSLSNAGDISAMNILKPLLPGELTQQTWFPNLMANTYTKAGKVDDFLRDVLPGMKPFPLGGLLGIIEARPDLEDQMRQLANKLATEEDYHQPLNMIWLNYMSKHRYQDANELFDANPKFKDNLLFSGLLTNVRKNKDTQLAFKLLDVLKTTNLTPRSLAIVYTAITDILVDSNKPEEAEAMLLKELIGAKGRVNSVTGEPIEPVKLTDLNRGALTRFAAKIREVCRREPKFAMPEKMVISSPSSSPSSSSSSSSDSDEEVAQAKRT